MVDLMLVHDGMMVNIVDSELLASPGIGFPMEKRLEANLRVNTVETQSLIASHRAQVVGSCTSPTGQRRSKQRTLKEDPGSDVSLPPVVLSLRFCTSLRLSKHTKIIPNVAQALVVASPRAGGSKCLETTKTQKLCYVCICLCKSYELRRIFDDRPEIPTWFCSPSFLFMVMILFSNAALIFDTLGPLGVSPVASNPENGHA